MIDSLGSGLRLGGRLWWGLLPLVVLLWGTGALATTAIDGLPSTPLGTLLAVPAVGFAREIALFLAVGSIAVRIMAPTRDTRAWASAWAVVGALLAAAEMLAVQADILANGLSASGQLSALADSIASVAAIRALAIQAACLLTAAVMMLLPRRQWITYAALGIALVGVCAPAFAGHAGVSGQHAVAAFSIAAHVMGSALWVGGLAAVVAVIARDPSTAQTLLPRFSVLALVCVIVVGESGLLTASILAGSLGDLLGTAYGSLVLAKVAALAWLVALGWQQRRKALDRLPNSRVPVIVAGIAAVELVSMGVVIAFAVVMTRIGPSPVPGEGFSPVSTIVLAIAIPLLVVRLRPRGWRLSDALPEAAAFVLLLAIVEVSGVGLLRHALGPVGLLLETALLVAAGWASLSSVEHSNVAAGILLAGMPVALVGSAVLSPAAWDVNLAVAAAALGEALLVAARWRMAG